MTTLNFLMPTCGVSTKKFKNTDGKWELEGDYKAGKVFKGFECPVESIEDAHELIKENQECNCFIVNGGIIEGTDTRKMVRRKRPDHKDGLKPTLADRDLSLFCLDVDGYDGTIEDFIETELPNEFHTADYIYQYSASYGLTSDQLKCHLFYWLETPILNETLRQWVKNSGIKALDPSVLTATQPIYIQKRICNGAPDPVEDFIGLIKKEGNLKWKPKIENKSQTKKPASKGNLNLFKSAVKKPLPKLPPPEAQATENNFDLTDSIEKILKAENYHESLNGVALSFLNRKVPPATVKAMLRGAMNAADSKDERWKARFADIGRAVNSAAEIVDRPTIDEVLAWVSNSQPLEIKAGFADKCLHLSPIDRRVAFEEIADKIGFGLRVLTQTLKLREKEYSEEQVQKAKEAKTEERESRGVYEIESLPSNNALCAEDAAKKLSESMKSPEVFTIGGSLASIVISQPKTIQQCSKYAALGKDYPKMPIISTYKRPFHTLCGRLEKDVVFVNEKGNDIIPNAVILSIIGEGTTQDFKPLTGIVEHPFIDNNWQLVQKSGYNKKTGLYTILHNKLKLEKMDAREAYNYLIDIVFDEFPFGSELDKAVAVSALCTAVQRPTIAGDTGMPGFGIVSPTQSSGKTTLAQLISYSIYNRPVAAQSWTDDDEELGKHLLGIFQEGHSCVLFDNIQQGAAIQNGRLANAMSNDMFGGRQLGVNKIIQVPSSVIWLFTGNGISFVGDFATRIYPININPKMEAPDTRNFKRPDIGGWAMDNRKKILSAVLSIIDGGQNVDGLTDSTRFKEWDKFVRRPVYNASGIDVNEAVQRNQKEDMINLVKNNLIRNLYETFENVSFTTRELKEVAFGSFDIGTTELGDAIKDCLGRKYDNTLSIGRYLASLTDNVFDGYTLKRKSGNVVQWRILEVESLEN